MAEYLIYFNEEWVTETSDEGWQQRSHEVRQLVGEMEAAGVLIFTGGLDDGSPVWHVEPRDGVPSFVEGPRAVTDQTFGGFAAVDVADEAEARHWAGRMAVACGWPQEVRAFRPRGKVPTPDADRAG